MALAKLEELTKTELYVRPENLTVNTAYLITKLKVEPNKWRPKEISILATLAINPNENVTGVMYLPFKYAEHPKHKLSSADVNELNKKIVDNTHSFYIVNKGTMAGQPVIEMVVSTPDSPLRYKIYEGKY